MFFLKKTLFSRGVCVFVCHPHGGVVTPQRSADESALPLAESLSQWRPHLDGFGPRCILSAKWMDRGHFFMEDGLQDGRDVTGWGFIPANYLFGDGQLNGLQLE